MAKLRELLQRLSTQLKNLDVPFTSDFESSLQNAHHVVDAIFGIFSSLLSLISTKILLNPNNRL